jgi:hypothetical protein
VDEPVLLLREEPRRGPRAGRYDDDEGTAAIVYLGEPFAADYVLIPRADLAAVGATSFQLERWKRAYPWLVKYLGVP